MNFTRVTERFKAFGVDLNNPVDSIRTDYYPILENLRAYTDGTLQPRQGLIDTGNVIAGQTPVLTVRRLNDPSTAAPNNYVRVIKVGTALSRFDPAGSNFSQLQYNAVNVLFSSNPVMMVPFRPDQSTSSWMYIADSLAMYKTLGYNQQGLANTTVHAIGLAPPTTEPEITQLEDMYYAANILNTATLGVSPNQFVIDSTAAAPNPVLATGLAIQARVPAGQTVTASMYEQGVLRWCTVVVPDTVAAVLGVGSVIGTSTGGVERAALVYEVFQKSVDTTVQAVLYDTAPVNTGICTIQPALSCAEITRNAAVKFVDLTIPRTFYTRVIEVIKSSGTAISFRCDTGANTVSAGETVSVVPSFKTYSAFGSISAGVVIADYIPGAAAAGIGAVACGGAGVTANKTGWIQQTPATPIDLSTGGTTGLGTGTLIAFTDEDYLHLSLQHSDISKLVQGRIMFDCSNTVWNISSSTNATPIVVTTSAPHGLAIGDTVFIQNHLVNTPANGTWVVSAVTSTTLTLGTGAFAPIGIAVGANTGTVKPQFKDNFFYRAFTASDLIEAVKGRQTALANQNVINTNKNISGGGIRNPLNKDIP